VSRAADTSIAMAQGSVKPMLQWLEEHNCVTKSGN
jgi:hypothetical protein